MENKNRFVQSTSISYVYCHKIKKEELTIRRLKLEATLSSKKMRFPIFEFDRICFIYSPLVSTNFSWYFCRSHCVKDLSRIFPFKLWLFSLFLACFSFIINSLYLHNFISNLRLCYYMLLENDCYSYFTSFTEEIMTISFVFVINFT